LKIEVRSSGFSLQRVGTSDGLQAKARTPNLRAFTLIEVILAIAIASGLLVVAISYYQRAADLRGQLIAESQKLATIRLLMDRISMDLRTAIAEPRQGFSGTSDYMKFAHAGNPSPGNLADGALKLVTYSVITNGESTNAVVIGFNRVETPLVEMRVAAATNQDALSFNGAMDPATTLTNMFVEPLTRAIRMVHFRYFDGAEWLDTWDSVDLPMGVEVTFGTEPPPQEPTDEEEEYGADLFRRVIFVPSGRSSSVWEDLP
jgi:prepilin-type N-terminal cleavage/methylation domain-containing protein